MTELEKWMQGPCEVRANGYLYPCTVLEKATLGDNYLVQLLLPSNTKFTMVVEKSLLMSRAHYNPTFDSKRVEQGRKEEFLYAIGTSVKTRLGDRKIYGVVTGFNPETKEYTILVGDKNGAFSVNKTEDKIKKNKPKVEEPRPDAKYEVGDNVRILNIASQFHNERGTVSSSVYETNGETGGWRYHLKGSRVSNVGYFMEEHLSPVLVKRDTSGIRHGAPIGNKYKIGESVSYHAKHGLVKGKVVAWNFISDAQGYSYALQVTDEEKGLKYRINGIAEAALRKVDETAVVQNREAEPKAEPKVTVSDIPKEDEEPKKPLYEHGDKVLISQTRLGAKSVWMPATIQHQDLLNPYIPISGSRWIVKFEGNEHEWSYPAERIKRAEEESVKEPEPAEEKVEEKFKAGDEVAILTGMFKGERGLIVQKYKEVISLKDNFWVVLMENSTRNRIIGENNLAFYVERPEEPKVEEPKKTVDEEVIDDVTALFAGFFKATEGILNEPMTNIDFKKVKNQIIGTLGEYLGKK